MKALFAAFSVIILLGTAASGQTLLDLGAMAPAVGSNDIAQLTVPSGPNSPDGLNYYFDNALPPGQTFTTGTNTYGYVMNTLGIKLGGNSGSIVSGGEAYYLRIYSVSAGTATFVTNFTSANNFVFAGNTDWLLWTNLGLTLVPSTQYAYSFSKLPESNGGSEYCNLANVSNNPYAGGEVCLLPISGGAMSLGSSHNFDATFTVGLSPVVGAVYVSATNWVYDTANYTPGNTTPADVVITGNGTAVTVITNTNSGDNSGTLNQSYFHSSLPVALGLTNVGDSITVTGSVSLKGSVASGGNEQFRFGLFQRGTNTSDTNWLGYLLQQSYNSGSGAFSVRNNPNTGVYASGTGSTAVEVPATAPAAWGAGAYACSLSVTLLSNGAEALQFSLTNASFNESGVYTNSGVSTAPLTFDSVGILAGASLYATAIVLSNVVVTYSIPIPSLAPPGAIQINPEPLSESVALGQPATFVSGATGPASFQWYTCSDLNYDNPAPLPGATNSTYTIASTVATNATNYYLVASNASSTATSSVAVLVLTSSLAGQPYTPPANNRADIVLDTNWMFTLNTVTNAQATNFNDSSWTNLNIPHTWNALDGQDGGGNYYRGIGWYRTHYTVSTNYANEHFFLKFDGAFLVTDVYLNGTFIGEHDGGFAAFVFDVTTNIIIGGDNVIAVEVNNAYNTNIPPLDADFTFFGGMYRDAHLLVTDPVQISPMDYGSPGVYLKPANVSSNSANLQVTTVVSNSSASPESVTVVDVITDAATNIVTELTNTVSLPANSGSNVVLATTIANPHLWNGLSDPYLYQAYVELHVGSNVTDLVQQPLGFRYYRVDPTNGFFLNGQYLDLHGVDMHQDWLNLGWALDDAHRQTNFMLLKDMGVTGMRLSHYEHHNTTYNLADSNGIVLWSEIPLIDRITESPQFYSNAMQQLRELIRQRYNHPSVVVWGVFNEITLESGPTPTNLVNQLVQLEAQEDPTRPSTGAVLAGNGDATSWMPQVVAFNEYYGWYESPLTGLGPWADAIHAAHPNSCIGISEFGAGASIIQHSENPVAMPVTTGGLFHPEEYQNIVHETTWPEMKARPFIWCKFIWNMFDFASDGRDEGDTPGRNDKGLTTYDRMTHKDAYYYYKANWTTNPMVYITGHTFTNRINSITAKVYANCDTVQLYVNGVSEGVQTGTNCVFTWPVTLAGGTNNVTAVGTKAGTNVTDSLVWIAPALPPAAIITSPSAPAVFLGSTNQTLQLSAIAYNNQSNLPPGSLTTTWGELSGPGTVVFGNTNILNTTASFPVNGVYGINFNATDAAGSSNAELAVIVNTNGIVTNGLTAWWKMNGTGGANALDSSGNNRTATNSGATYVTGYTGGANAISFNGGGSVASFSSPDAAQMTIAGWVNAAGEGNSSYPRIVETAGYRFFFRYDTSGSNGLDFATFTSTANGDWFSGPNTVSFGSWYHVAASYDRTSLTNVPTLYVNGIKMSVTTVAAPSGTTPASSGTGYIGNRAALDLAWNGSVEDLRLYNRILSDAEVMALASLPPANLAPVVNAGTNQSILWPASANLNGTASDDGFPVPPGALTTTWSEVSGPGAVTFGNANATATTGSFSSGGTYVLQLAAFDGQDTTVSDVTVTVISPPSISAQHSGGAWQLTWPTNGGNWTLQTQTNNPGSGLGTNWVTVPGAAGAYTVPVNPAAGSAFFRLIQTN